MVTPHDIGVHTGRPWVMIPTCGESEHLLPLVRGIAQHNIGVCVVINNLDDRPAIKLMGDVVAAGGFVYMWPGEANIYEIWNWAIKQGQDHGTSSVSILNDDIRIEPYSIQSMDQEFSLYHNVGILGWDYSGQAARGLRFVNGSMRKGGIGGFAFMVQPNRVPFIDERFSWWGGDDDLFLGTNSLGFRLAVHMNHKVAHFTSTSASARPHVYERCEQDRQLLLSKWGDTW